MKFGNYQKKSSTVIPSALPTLDPTFMKPDCSRKNCGNLRWDVNAKYSTTVCANRHKKPLTDCSGALDYDQAKAFCEDVGARLCTMDEIQASFTAETGCQ